METQSQELRITLQETKTETVSSVELRCDGIAQGIAPGSLATPRRQSSPPFGIGFRVTVEIVQGAGSNKSSSLRIAVSLSNKRPPMIVACTFTLKTLLGAILAEKTRQNTTIAHGRGQGCTLPLPANWDQTVLCNVVIRSSESDTLVASLSDASLDILHFSMLGSAHGTTCAISNVHLYAYDCRGRNGRLSGRRELHVAPDILAKAGSCTFESVITRGVNASLWLQGPVTLPVLAKWAHPDSDLSDEEADPSRSDTLDHGIMKLEDSSIVQLLVNGASARTLEAVLYWSMTGWVLFKPLSTGNCGPDELAAFNTTYDDTFISERPRPASCKSIYRVARALGFKELEACALAHLKDQITADNVLDELFSEFTSQFDDAKAVVMLAVVEYWNILKSSPKLEAKMAEIASGKLPHAGKIMAELWVKVSVVDDPVANRKKDGQTAAVAESPRPSQRRRIG